MSTADTLNIVLSICAVPLAGVISALLLKARDKLGMQTTAQDRANMEAEVQASIGAGIAVISKTAPQILKDGITTPEGLHDVATAAADYMRTRFPDRVSKIAQVTGADTSDALHAAVQQTIASRLANVNPVTALMASPGPVLTGSTAIPATTLAAPSV